ncbi:BASIC PENTACYSTEINE 7 protein [Nymphaea thermarum]|nr:BASIC PENTACYSTEINE 7 protein [Nymphaea thermarum]
MDERSRMDHHLRHWGFPGQQVNGNPMLKSLAGATVLDSSVTVAERTATVMLNGAFADRKPSYAEAQAAASSMGFPGHRWPVMPSNMHPAQPPNDNPDNRVKETQSVLGVPSQEVNNGNTTSKPGKGRKPRASTKTSNSSAPKVSKPKQSKKKESLPTNKESGRIPREKPDKKSLDIVINGETYDIASIPVPVCSCTGVPRQCYKWGVGGWQSSCCTTSMSVYPLPLNNTRPGARIAGRKMSNGAYRKVLERVAAEGHDLSSAIDLKNYWAKHGTNKFVTIR